jgi:hypothetical protein
MVAEYDVQHESAFARDKLGKVIPERLQELLDALNASGGRVEDWYYGLVSKMLLGLNRACNGLLKTMDEDNLSGAAWNARNCLELWVWAEYCSKSRENAWRFHGDALRDMQGIFEAHGAICRVFGQKNEFEISGQDALNRVAVAKLGLQSVDSNYLKVLEAAKSVGLEPRYASNNKFLSKLAHPTAGLVIGLMHNDREPLWNLQMSCTTFGMYFAGQCVMALERIVAAIP